MARSTPRRLTDARIIRVCRAIWEVLQPLLQLAVRAIAPYRCQQLH